MDFLAFTMPGGWEWVFILLIGLLLFGRRLPEVGRSLGKSIVEFKKGVKGIQDEIDEASSESDHKREKPKAQLGDESRSGQSLETDPRTVSTREAVE